MSLNKKKKDLKQLLKIAEQRKFPKLNPYQKLSLCLITKNEEKNIARCLESVQGIVDEIILLDTGSTDKTVEIAKNYNAKVFYSEWENDFAKARNEAIDKATGDWILILDADEELREESKGQIRVFMIPVEDPICYTIRIKNFNEKNEIQHSNYMTRFFKNHPSLRFKGKIHEAIYTENRVMLADDNIYILHHGYKDAVKNAEKFKNRNNPIIEELFNQEDINNDYKSFLGFYLGSDKVAAKDYEGAIKEFEDAIERSNIDNEAQHEFHLHLYSQLAFTYILNSDFDKARSFLDKSSKELPKITTTYEYWTDLGHLEFIDNNLDLACKYFTKAIDIFENKELNYFRVVTDPFYYYFSINGLIQSYMKLEKKSEAIQILDKSFNTLKIRGSSSGDYLSISYLYISCSEYEKALEALLLAKDLSDEDAKNKLLKYASNLYLRLNRFYEAIVTQAKIHDIEKVKENWYAIAQSLEDEKQFQFSEQVYSAIIDVIPGETNAYLGRVVSNLIQNKSLKALEDLANAKKFAISIDDRIKIAMLYFQVGQAYQTRILLDEILKESPEHHEANLYKASLEQSEGKIEEAKNILLKVIDLYSQDNRAFIQLANLMLANQNNDEAIEYYNKALEMDQKNAYIPYALALSFLNKGDKEKASQYLDKAIELQPDDEGLMKIKEQLQLA